MLFIVNPRSGKEKIKNRLLGILDLFIKAGYQVQIHITQSVLDAKNVVELYGFGQDLIVCSGGDGTLNEVVSGLMTLESPPSLGYIPAGSTNDFASSLKLPKNMLAAAKTVLEGEDYPIDIGVFCKRKYFVYVAGFGAFTEVSYLTSQDRKNVLGHQAYVLEGVKSLSSIKAYAMRIRSEELVLEGEFIFGMVTNTISVGGFKGLVDPNVALNDGWFEVLLIRVPKKPLEVSEIVSALLLREESSELVLRFKTRSLQIEAEEPVDWVLDGEFGGRESFVQIENLYRRVKIRRKG